MSYLDNVLFAIVLAIGFGYFFSYIKKIIRNINLGIDVEKDNAIERWKKHGHDCFRAVKMVKRLQDHAHHCLCRFCNYKY
jgi:hypothetical protein